MTTSQRYCIGCQHLQYLEKIIQQGSSYTGAWTAQDAQMSCRKGFWKSYLYEANDETIFNLERAMQAAQDCPQYVERTIEKVQP